MRRVIEPTEELLRPGEVADLLRVDPRTIRNWAMSGRLVAIVTPGGHRRYRRTDVDRLLGMVAAWDARR